MSVATGFDRGAFGRRLRALRAGRHLSQESLARMSGVSAMAISRYEHGLNSPSVESVLLLADAFGMTPGELIGWGDGSDAE